MNEHDRGGGASLATMAHSSEEEEEDSRSAGKSGGGAVADAAKKPRGRPPGSKNKPKPPIFITRDSESAMRPVVLELSAGYDVVKTVAHFARRRHVGVSVLSATGSVANVTLRHPATHSSTFTLHGRFDILSLSGTFLPSPPPSSSSSPPPSSSSSKSPFTISLAGAQGQVIGGTVAGALIAAGTVVLVAASFMNPSYHRFPEEEEEAEDTKPSIVGADSGNDSSMAMSMSMSVYSVAAPSPLNCQIPAEILPWCPTSRPPSYL